MPDPTRHLPPSDLGPARTVVPAGGSNEFTRPGNSDGSERSHAGWRAGRAAFVVAQVSGNHCCWILEAAVLGPLNGWMQTIPLAEVTAASHFVHDAADMPGLVLHTDCKWVVDGFEAGLEATGSALKVHAEVWRFIRLGK